MQNIALDLLQNQCNYGFYQPISPIYGMQNAISTGFYLTEILLIFALEEKIENGYENLCVVSDI